MIGISVLLIAIPAGIALSALIGVWIGKGLCSLSEWRHNEWHNDDNESGSNPL